MKAAALFAAALATVTPPPAPYGPGTTHYDGAPPERYLGDATVMTYYLEDVEPLCGKPPEGMVRLGCTRTYHKQTIVVLLNPDRFMGDDPYARLVAHELAHVRGWPADHPL